FEVSRQGVTTTDRIGSWGYNNGRRSSDYSDAAYTNNFGGTSAATPITAGVFGLMLASNPDLSRDQVVAMIVASADNIAADVARYDRRTGFRESPGYGRVNAHQAVLAEHLSRKYSQR